MFRVCNLLSLLLCTPQCVHHQGVRFHPLPHSNTVACPGSSAGKVPTMWETWVRSLGQEDPLEESMATPVFLPGEFHGQRSLVGYSPWGREELDMSDLTQHKTENNHTYRHLLEEDTWGLSPLPRLLLYGHFFLVRTGVRWGGGKDRVILASGHVTFRAALSGKPAPGPGLCSWGSCWCPLSGFLAASLLLSLRAAGAHWEGEDPAARNGVLSCIRLMGRGHPSWPSSQEDTLAKWLQCPQADPAPAPGMTTPSDCLRLLRPDPGQPPEDGAMWERLYVWESVEGWGRGERGDSPAEPQLSRPRHVLWSSVQFPFPLLARTEP